MDRITPNLIPNPRPSLEDKGHANPNPSEGILALAPSTSHAASGADGAVGLDFEQKA